MQRAVTWTGERQDTSGRKELIPLRFPAMHPFIPRVAKVSPRSGVSLQSSLSPLTLYSHRLTSVATCLQLAEGTTPSGVGGGMGGRWREGGTWRRGGVRQRVLEGWDSYVKGSEAVHAPGDGEQRQAVACRGEPVTTPRRFR